MIRSRLRRPTSKSMTATFLPACARPVAREALVVVLPTPPLPEVTTMISAKVNLRMSCGCPVWTSCLDELVGRACLQRLDEQFFTIEPTLHGLAGKLARNFFEYAVVAGDGNQFGPEIGAVDARVGVALGANQRAAAQGAVDVDGAVGDHFRAVGDRGGDDQVAVARVDLLSGAHGLGVAQCDARLRRVFRGGDRLFRGGDRKSV